MKNLEEWGLDPQVIYLNHGSFGPIHQSVFAKQQQWQRQINSNPMQFFAREHGPAQEAATEALANWLHADSHNLILTANATEGMNLVANVLPLQANDEVLLTDHEYGAVVRIWRKRCQQVGAKLTTVNLPQHLTNAEDITESIRQSITPRTKLIVISHLTSPTAILLPVEQITQVAQQHKIPLCIDGPHALAQVDINLKKIKCDFYVASCHKWLSAPFGSGFFYAKQKWHSQIIPNITSWGGQIPGTKSSWKDEHLWSGTRDLSARLTIPAAIQFLENYGFQQFQEDTHRLAKYAWQKLTSITGITPEHPNSPVWYRSMITLPLPESVPLMQHWAGEAHPLQRQLQQDFQIEIPVLKFRNRMYLRVSCHLYNDETDIDALADALSTLLR